MRATPETADMAVSGVACLQGIKWWDTGPNSTLLGALDTPYNLFWQSKQSLFFAMPQSIKHFTSGKPYFPKQRTS
jgi:hypothetical protein